MALWIGAAIAAAALCYTLLSIGSCLAFARQRSHRSSSAPGPVSVLKPLCGDEPRLYENLKSFFQQDEPAAQIVFGVHTPDDPALAAVQRLREEYPDQEVAIAVGRPPEGQNPKIENLLAMLPLAQHEILVLADSDIWAPPEYLRTVTAPLSRPEVGAVTCPYLGSAASASLPNRLGLLHLSDHFLPAVLVARTLGERGFCLGATVALRKKDLAAIGGFERLRSALADDYEIGRRLQARGLTIELSTLFVETTVSEPNFERLWSHELRWARTLRSVRPLGCALSFLSYPLSASLVASAFMASAPGGTVPAALCALLGLVSRLGLSRIHAAVFKTPDDLALGVMRDLLSFAVWCASWFGHTILWRGQPLLVSRGGLLHRAPRGPLPLWHRPKPNPDAKAPPA